MYHFKNLLTAVFFVPFLMANPVSYNEWDGEDGHYPRDNCITDSAATKLASIWENLYVNFDVAVAKKYLAPDLRVISDSINFLVVAPLKNATVGAVTVHSRAEFIKEETGVKNAPTFTTLNVWHSCDSVTLRWKWNVKPIASIGIDVLQLQPGTHLIQTDYSENNMLAYLYDVNCSLACTGH